MVGELGEVSVDCLVNGWLLGLCFDIDSASFWVRRFTRDGSELTMARKIG